jgi:hypothetical protein
MTTCAVVMSCLSVLCNYCSNDQQQLHIALSSCTRYVLTISYDTTCKRVRVVYCYRNNYPVAMDSLTGLKKQLAHTPHTPEQQQELCKLLLLMLLLLPRCTSVYTAAKVHFHACALPYSQCKLCSSCRACKTQSDTLQFSCSGRKCV